jgi:hypothetical protein
VSAVAYRDDAAVECIETGEQSVSRVQFFRNCLPVAVAGVIQHVAPFLHLTALDRHHVTRGFAHRRVPRFAAVQHIKPAGMTHERTLPYYPQSNRELERRRKSLKSE